MNRYRYYRNLPIQLQRENNFTEYYRSQLKQNEIQQILIHDTKKHLQTIDLLNQKGEQEKISQYISQIVDSSKLQEPSTICDHELLNMLLCQYREKCREYKIRFSADVRSKVLFFMEESDLTSLICNLLDNAVEAAVNCPDPFIEINIKTKEKTSITVLNLTNSCTKSPFTGNSEKLISSKQNSKKHGFGMKSIRRVTDKYQGHIHMRYEEENHVFHTAIILNDLFNT
ncbi:MAG: GHKL domain-containing protein [Roseburia sp.]|nr:GHKL domain-containing protein [Roseburia sp.]